MVLAVALVVIGFGSLVGAFLYGSYMMGNQQAALQQSQFPQGMMGSYTGTFTGFGGMMGTQTGIVTNGQAVTIFILLGGGAMGMFAGWMGSYGLGMMGVGVRCLRLTLR